jgi:hypothetical protein
VREGNAYFFSKYPLFDEVQWGMFIFGATFIIFHKCSRGYIFSRGWYLEKVG